ncbi:MAG TPA: OmpA family protein [Chthoniobacterales bacterium]
MKKTVVSCCLLILALGACKKVQNQEYAGVDGDYVNGTPLPPRQEGVSFLSDSVQKGQFAPILFGFDRAEVSPNERPKVQEIASFMRRENRNVILAGFTDERGTEEYNRALGERRAQAVRSALSQEGVSPARLQTVSFGLEMPADPAHGENAWAKNRRVEVGVVR